MAAAAAAGPEKVRPVAGAFFFSASPAREPCSSRSARCRYAPCWAAGRWAAPRAVGHRAGGRVTGHLVTEEATDLRGHGERRATGDDGGGAAEGHQRLATADLATRVVIIVQGGQSGAGRSRRGRAAQALGADPLRAARGGLSGVRVTVAVLLTGSACSA
ncbi:hypothetical protein NKG94_46300 [Micromonospora sp. M12]